MNSLLTVKESAKYFGIHPSTIYRLINRGDSPFQRRKGIGYRARESDLDDWWEETAVSHPPIADLLPKIDIALDGYDKLFLERRTEMNGTVRYRYPFGSVLMRKTKRLLQNAEKTRGKKERGTRDRGGDNI